jgi:hypothetical protein
MIFNYKYLNKQDPYPTTIVSLNDVPIENKVVFRYLGNDIKYDEPSTGDAEITLRINLTGAKFQELKPKLRNFNISLSIRMLFLNALSGVVSPTDSAQTWNLTTTQANGKVDSCYYAMLRRMLRMATSGKMKIT